jgi:hypothetical protein
MNWRDRYDEIGRYEAELKQILAGDGLSPDTRARPLRR